MLATYTGMRVAMPGLLEVVMAVAALAMGLTGTWLLTGLTAPKAMGGRRLSDCVDAGTAEALERTVAEYARQLGMRAPRLYVIPSPAANALAFGVGPTAAVAITEGMVESLGVRELQAVLAHEMAHLRSGDSFAVCRALMISGTVNVVAAVVGVTIAAVLWVFRIITALFGARQLAKRADCAQRVLVDRTWFMCDRVVATVAGMSSKVEFAADRLGAQLAGRQAMLAALCHIENLNAEVHMLGWLAQLYATHPAIADRVQALTGDM